MTLQDYRACIEIRDRLEALMHGESKNKREATGKPIGKSIYIESWIMPKLAEMIERGKKRWG